METSGGNPWNRFFFLEDDDALGRGIAMALSGPDRAVTQADSVARAREALALAQFDLLIFRHQPARRQRAGAAARPAPVRGPDAGHPPHCQRPGAGRGGWPGGRGGRLHHQALLPGGAPGPGQCPAAPRRPGPAAAAGKWTASPSTSPGWSSPKDGAPIDLSKTEQRPAAACWWKPRPHPAQRIAFRAGVGTGARLWTRTPCPWRWGGCGPSWAALPSRPSTGWLHLGGGQMTAPAWALLALAAAGLAFGLWQWTSRRRTLRRLNNMLDRAIAGAFPRELRRDGSFRPGGEAGPVPPGLRRREEDGGGGAGGGEVPDCRHLPPDRTPVATCCCTPLCWARAT